MEEAIEWVRRCPNPDDGEWEIEIRQVFEAEDFGEALTPELREQEEQLRAADRGRRVAQPWRAPTRTRAIEAVWRIESAPADRGRAAHGARPRPRRRPRPGRARRGPRAVARVGRPATTRAPGSWRRRSTAASTCCARRAPPDASTRSSRAERRRGRPALRPRGRPRRRRSATTCSRLIFTACHPVLSTDARVALTLRLLGGLTTDEIARAFLVPGADRRAAHRAGEADAGEGERAVRGAARTGAPARLASVLEVVYLVFNEGYSATAGEHWVRPALV